MRLYNKGERVDYYSCIVAFSLLAMLCLTMLVKANVLIKEEQKKRFYLSYTLIIISLISEWGAIAMNGMPLWSISFHKFIKLIDYVITPVAGMFFYRQVSNKKLDFFPISIMVINLAIQICSLFTGWTFYIDDLNIYRHGEYYWFYIIIYILSIIYVVYGFLTYSKEYTQRNKATLYLIVLTCLVGIGFQELVSNNIRTTCLSLSVCSILLYIYCIDFLIQRSDKQIVEQKQQLEHDALTGLFNRFSFEKTIHMSQQHFMIRDLTVFAFDINGLKIVNDTYGHDAGDELIISAANIIMNVFSSYGKCFRIGGDEMAAILLLREEEISSLITEFDYKMDNWKGVYSDKLSIAYGYVRADHHPSKNLEELYKLADHYMYENKMMYYQKQ